MGPISLIIERTKFVFEKKRPIKFKLELVSNFTYTFLSFIFISMNGTAPVAGIDLGTCFSCVYVYKNGTYVSVPIDGDQTVPSIISYYNNQFHFGYPAKENHKNHPLNTFYDVKRMIGLDSQQCGSVVFQANYAFKMFDIQGSPCYCIYDESTGNPMLYINPQRLDAAFLQHLVKQASDFIGKEIKDVVITVPAFFTEIQSRATWEAAQMAGFNVMQILREPSAAVMALDPAVQTAHYIAYDLGGGTFDVAILRVNGMDFQVIYHDGHLRLGGQDFDNKLYEYIKEGLRDLHNIDISTWKVNAKARLLRDVENIKIALSTQDSYTIDLTEYGYEDDEIEITRDEFEECIEDLINESIHICKRVVIESGIGRKINNERVELGPHDKILLVGGSSAIPLVRKKLIEEFGNRIIQTVNPNTVVAKGACMTAVQWWNKAHSNNRFGPITTPVVHNIVVRSVFIKMNDNEYEEILPRGSPCDEWRNKKVEITGFFTRSATVELATKDDETGNYKQLGHFNINPRIFNRGLITFELKMNDQGKLCYKYGTASEVFEEGEVDLQGQMDQSKLNTEIIRFALLKKYKDYFLRAKDCAKNKGPEYQTVYKYLCNAVDYIRGPSAMAYELSKLQDFCSKCEAYIRHVFPDLNA